MHRITSAVKEALTPGKSAKSPLAYDAQHALNAVCPYFTMFPLEVPLAVLRSAPRNAFVASPSYPIVTFGGARIIGRLSVNFAGCEMVSPSAARRRLPSFCARSCSACCTAHCRRPAIEQGIFPIRCRARSHRNLITQLGIGEASV